MVWVLDLDGVVWLGDQPLAGAAEAVARLRAAGERVVFVTNNSNATLAEQEAKLVRFGVATEHDVVSSATAAGALVRPGERVLVCGGPGIDEAVAARGARPVRVGGGEPTGERDPAIGGSEAGIDVAIDAVVVGLDRDFDYVRLRAAVRAIQRGARFVATNDDATYPTPDGPDPGGGALVAAIAYATRVEPEIAGKPHEPMAQAVQARVAGADGDAGTVVGDRPETDGLFAAALGYRFALVLTGVTGPDDLPVSPMPEVVAPSLAALLDEDGFRQSTDLRFRQSTD